MTVHCITPYSTTKRLGIAYNEAMSRIPEGDWACITDWDVLFLLPDTIMHLNEYAARYPDTGIFTCYVSRTHHINTGVQMFETGIDPSDSILHHTGLAKKQTEQLYTVTDINRFISGFLMMVSKETWNKHKFAEDLKCLSVDNVYSNKILTAGMPIRRMNGIYLWHSYRIGKDIKDVNHLL